jgi:predicted lipoprotein
MKSIWTQEVLVLSFILGISLYACDQIEHSPMDMVSGEKTTLADGSPFSRALLLESFGNCIMGEIESFQEQSARFATIANQAIDDPTQFEATQQAWQKTIDLWQQLEVMQIGPAGRSTQPGGQDLRDLIYAWPLTYQCAIDRNLLSEAYITTPSQIEFDDKGLWAAEYLLFYKDTENQCGLDDDINASGSWSMLDANTLTLRRAQYAAFAADTVAEIATALFTAWSPTGDNFLAELTKAGETSRTYGRKSIAINAMNDALSYIEWATKDKKLAHPLGLHGCDQSLCPDLVESKYSQRSKEHLRNNLIGFRKIFKGCENEYTGLGFDDLLYVIGQADLAEEIDQALLATFKAIEDLEEMDLVTALDTNSQKVLAIHTALKKVTDLLRSDFLIVLNLELPKMVQSDND